MSSKIKDSSLFSSALYLHGSIPLPLEGDFLKEVSDELYAPNLLKEFEDSSSFSLIIKDIIDKLNRERTPFLCGYSMGGRILQYILTKLSYTPKLIVLISSALPIGSTAEREARLRLDISRSKNLESNFKDFLQSWYSAELWSLKEEEKNKIIANLLTTYDTPKKLETLAQLFTYFSPGKFPQNQPDSRDQLEPLITLRKSVLVYFYGEYDLKYKEEALRFKALNSKNKSYEIRESGHKVHFVEVHQEQILQKIRSHISA